MDVPTPCGPLCCMVGSKTGSRKVCICVTVLVSHYFLGGSDGVVVVGFILKYIFSLTAYIWSRNCISKNKTTRKRVTGTWAPKLAAERLQI